MSIVYEERDALAFVRLARAARGNALTGAMLARLGEIFEGVARRRDLRAVILSGEGENFCAGTDGAEPAAFDAAGARLRAAQSQAVCDAIEGCGVPVVCALWGRVVGVGCELAFACHLRVAAGDAVFRLSEHNAAHCSTDAARHRLALIAGPALAAIPGHEHVIAGETLLRLFVNLVVTREEVLAAAEQLARTIIDNGAPLAARACLEAVARGARLPLAEGLNLEAELFSRLFSTADAREGLAAFLEKRKPVFKGE